MTEEFTVLNCTECPWCGSQELLTLPGWVCRCGWDGFLHGYKNSRLYWRVHNLRFHVMGREKIADIQRGF